jgi:hypothetical protein
MVWDLRGALLKKAEVESARLDHFEFRQRARTFRLLAERIGASPDDLVRRIAVEPDEAILDHVQTIRPDLDVRELYTECREEARRQLIAEIGDPTPHKLA